MNKLYCIDLSFRTGVAYFEDDELISYGFHEGIRPKGSQDFKNLIEAIDDLISTILTEILEIQPNEIVIEQTNRGRNRYTQKQLEWMHLTLLRKLYDLNFNVYYLDTSEWKSLLGIKIDKNIRKFNAKLRKEGGRGKIKAKHVSIHYVNEKYQLDLLTKNDDEAEAILLGLAFIKVKNEIGLEKFYSERDLKMKTARKEGTQKTKRKRTAKEGVSGTCDC